MLINNFGVENIGDVYFPVIEGKPCKFVEFIFGGFNECDIPVLIVSGKEMLIGEDSAFCDFVQYDEYVKHFGHPTYSLLKTSGYSLHEKLLEESKKQVFEISGYIRIDANGKTYDIPRCDLHSMQDIVDTYFHLKGKTWINESIAKRFIKVACRAKRIECPKYV